ncbi:mucin-2 [Larus michahellis]
MGLRAASLFMLWLALSYANEIRKGRTRNHGHYVCSTWGNNHFKTFDGDIYQFPGICEYNFASDCRESYKEFSIHIQRGLNSHNHPEIQYILITIKDFTVYLRPKLAVVDGRIVKTPYYSSVLLIESNDIYTKVYAKLGLILIWNHEDALMVELDSKFNNHTCGLCGDYNGVPIYNEFINGDASYNSITYGNLQKISKPNTKCEDPDETQALPSCDEHRDECESLLTSSAFADCRLRLNLEMYIQACMQDKCACSGNEDSFCLCSTVSEYSRQCSHAGGRPSEWRTWDFCPKTCPDTMVYRESSSPCMDTCSHLEISSLCEEHYVDGCFCPEGTVYDDITEKGCIPANQCHCRLHGKEYSPGESITIECEECTCDSGRWTCKDLPCPGTCSVEGGSHITTFDGKKYTFHGDCYYMLAKGTADDSHALLAELAPCGSTDRQTCLKSLVLLADHKKNVVVFRSDGSVLLNEMTVNVPHVSASFSVFRPSSYYLIVQTSFGLQLQIQLVPVMQLFVTVDQSVQGKLQGLCGNFNGVEGDDFKTSSGLVEATGSAFANTWKAQSTCTDQVEKLEDPCSLSIESANYAEHWCSLLKNPEGPFARCHLVIDPSEYYKKCKYDTCLCEDGEECLCAALSSYSRACAFKGIILGGWRKSVCSNEVSACPGNQIFLYNLTMCQQTCRSLADGEKYCLQDFVPVDGCGCPHNTYLDNQGTCVPVSKCPCYYKGSYLEAGEHVTKDGERCVCRNAKIQCTSVTIRMKNATECSSNKMYFDCNTSPKWTSQTPVQRSCHTRRTDHFQAECVSGCVCPKGLFDDGKGGCVREKDCPCSHNNQQYSPGEKITVDCNTCTCQNGDWSCTKDVCYGTCIIYGSGHYITFDGKFYDFDGSCEYVATQDFCGDKNSSGSFSIITENVPCGTTGVTCSKAIKIFLGKTELKLENKDYKEIQRDHGDDVKYWNRTVGLYLVIEASNGVMLIWDKKTTVFIKLTPDYKGKVCGLCGNFDDKSNNDFTTRNGLQETNALKFGNSWKQSFVCPDVTEEIKPCDVKPHRKSWAEKECNIIRSPVFKICHSKVDPTPFYEACVHDACSCDSGGDCECFCSAVAAYAQECTKAQACVFWRTPDICPIFCDYYNPRNECDWHYEPCGSDVMTCRMINHVSTNFSVPYLEGCYPRCPEDKPVYNEETKECVHGDECGCYVNGTYYPPGNEIPTKENCTQCECGPAGSIECKPLPGCPCVINGTRYEVNQTVAHIKDGDICKNYICAENGSIVEITYPCPTSASPTTISTFSPVITLTATVTSTSTPVSTTPCSNFICDWTEWFDVSNPEKDGGDYETYDAIRQHGNKICQTPEKIECRAKDSPHLSLEELGQKVECNVTYGLICRNEEQDPTMWELCYNYEIRVNCCEEHKVPCATESTPSLTPTATSTTTSTTIPITTTTRQTTSIITTPIPTPTITRQPPPSVTTPVITVSSPHVSTTVPTPTPSGPSSSTTTMPPSSTPGTTTTVTGTPTPTPTTTSTSITTSTVTVTPSLTPSPAIPEGTLCSCEWTDWIDVSYPDGSDRNSGDYETFENILKNDPSWVCAKVENISCRAEKFPEVAIEDLGQKVECSVDRGLICNNSDQRPGGMVQIPVCLNYEISVCCTPDRPDCIPTPTPSTTTTTPSSTTSSLPTSTTAPTPSGPPSSTTTTTTPTTTTPPTSTTTSSTPGTTTTAPGTPTPTPTTTSTSVPTPTYTTSLPSPTTPPREGTTTESGTSTKTSTPVTPSATPLPTTRTTETESSVSTTGTTIQQSTPSVPTSTVTVTTSGVTETGTTSKPTTSGPTPSGSTPRSTTVITEPSTHETTTTGTSSPPTGSRTTAISTPTSSTPGTTTTAPGTPTPTPTTTSTSVPTPTYTTSLPSPTTTPGEGTTTESGTSTKTSTPVTPSATPLPTTRTTETESSVSTTGTTIQQSTPSVPTSTVTVTTSGVTETGTTSKPTTSGPTPSGSTPRSTTIITEPSTHETTTTGTSSPPTGSRTTAISTPTSSSPGTTTTAPGTPTPTPTTTSTSVPTPTYTTSLPSPATTPGECSCEWTDWIDVSYPDGSDRNSGDYETFENILKNDPSWVCAKVENISCRAEKFPEVAIEDLGQKVECSVDRGLICNNSDQRPGGMVQIPVCLNYEISVCCTPDRPDCIPTPTPSTTTTTPSSTTSSLPTSTTAPTPSGPPSSTTTTTTPTTTTPPTSTTTSSTPGTTTTVPGTPTPTPTTTSTSVPTPTYTTSLPSPTTPPREGTTTESGTSTKTSTPVTPSATPLPTTRTTETESSVSTTGTTIQQSTPSVPTSTVTVTTSGVTETGTTSKPTTSGPTPSGSTPRSTTVITEPSTHETTTTGTSSPPTGSRTTAISTPTSSTPGTTTTAPGTPTPTPTTTSTSVPTPTYTTSLPSPTTTPGEGTTTESGTSTKTSTPVTPSATPLPTTRTTETESSVSTTGTTIQQSTPSVPTSTVTVTTSGVTETGTTSKPTTSGPTPSGSTPRSTTVITEPSTHETTTTGTSSPPTGSRTTAISTPTSSTPGTTTTAPGTPTPTPTTTSTSVPTPTYTTSLPSPTTTPGEGTTTESGTSTKTSTPVTPSATPLPTTRTTETESSVSTTGTTIQQSTPSVPTSTVTVTTSGVTETGTTSKPTTSGPTPSGSTPRSTTVITEPSTHETTTTGTSSPPTGSRTTAISTPTSSTPGTTTTAPGTPTPTPTTTSTSVPTPTYTTSLPSPTTTPGEGTTTESGTSTKTSTPVTPSATPLPTTRTTETESSVSTTGTTIQQSTPSVPTSTVTVTTSGVTETGTTSKPTTSGPTPSGSTPRSTTVITEPSTHETTTTGTSSPPTGSRTTAISTPTSSTPGTTTTAPGTPTPTPTTTSTSVPTPTYTTSLPSPTTTPGEGTTTESGTSTKTSTPVTPSATPLPTTRTTETESLVSTTGTTIQQSTPSVPTSTVTVTTSGVTETGTTSKPTTSGPTPSGSTPRSTTIITEPSTHETTTTGTSSPPTGSRTTAISTPTSSTPGTTTTVPGTPTRTPITRSTSRTPVIITKTPHPPTTLPQQGTVTESGTSTKTSTPVTPSATPLPTTRTTETESLVSTTGTTIQQSTPSVPTSTVTVTTSGVTETGTTSKPTTSGPTPSGSTPRSTTIITEPSTHETTTTGTSSPPTGSRTTTITTTTSGPSSPMSTASTTSSPPPESTSTVIVTTSGVTETGTTSKATTSGPTPSGSTPHSTTIVTEFGSTMTATASHTTLTRSTTFPATTTSGPSSVESTASTTVSLPSLSTSPTSVTTSGTTPTESFTTTSGTTSRNFTAITATTTTSEIVSTGSAGTSGPTATSSAVTISGSSTHSRVTPPSPPSSTTSPKNCTISPNESYAPGDSWWLCNCTNAICIEDNIIQLVPIICNPPPKPTCANGLSPVPVVDKDGCCWHWECDCYCTGWGDPHYMTFDGLYYSYQGNCTYVLVEEINKEVDNFGVYIDNYHCDTRDVVSCPRTIIVRHETQEVRIATVKPNTLQVEVTVNKQPVALPYKKFGVSIYESGINHVVEIPELKMNVTYNGLSFSIRMPYSRFGNNTHGQCGVCNNNTADDCMLPNGNIAENCETMADHWQVVDPSKPQCSPGLNPTKPPITTPAESCKNFTICELLLGSVFEPCHSFVRPERYYAACLFDSCALPGLDLECSSLQVYAATCADQSVCIDWRSHTNGVCCAYKCPSDKEYRACGPIKETTCKSSQQNETSTKYVEGCFCPNGTMLYDDAVDVCVKTCGCVGVDMIPREFGEKFTVDCQDCICLEGGNGIVCEPHVCAKPNKTSCDGEGFYEVNEVNSEDSCCPIVTCKCNTSLCTTKAPKCALGFEVDSHIPSGQCCPVYQCVPKRVCVHQNAEFLPNSSVFIDKCQNCFCTNEVNVSTQLNIISCEHIPCNTYCKPGYELQPVKGECCGRCVQTKCVIRTANNSNLILSPGEFKNDPYNNCTIYSCSNIHNQLISSTSEITCPAFNEDTCKPGTITFLPNGCCKTCTPLDSGTPCFVRERKDFIVYKGCRSVDRVVMTECEGTCGTFSLYSAEANSMEHSCSCCRETRTTVRKAELKCPNGHSISHEYIYVESCSCQDTECRSSSQSSESQSTEENDKASTLNRIKRAISLTSK